MKIIMKDIDDVIPYENNPRKNDEAVEYVANSIKEFGFKVPVIIDKNGVIVAGHTRLKAAKQLGIKKVPCIVADDLSDEQIKAFRLADNKVGEIAEWDIEKLASELETIDFDMSVFSFDDMREIETVEDTEEPVIDDKSFNYQEQYGVIVMCENETEQETIYNDLIEQGYNCKVVTT